MRPRFSVLFTFASLVFAGLGDSADPVVQLPYGSFRGQVVGATTQFLGMPFAAPPTGDRRFGFPEPPVPFSGIRDATDFGAPCYQQALEYPPNFPVKFPGPRKNGSEDCLFINVVRPTNISGEKPLPVLVFIYGGAFEVSDSSLFPGDVLVNRSVALGEPIIYVTINYRLNAFGFLGGKEVKERGLTNIGMRDQRFALQWIQQNIAAFGGNPKHVTIWGQSSGAISVGLHMLFNEGDTCGLFSAGIMESGSPLRLPDVLDNQVYFDNLVSATNCTDAPDRFECLKQAPFSAIQRAVDESPGFLSYQSTRLAWTPMVDGTLIPRNPMQLVESGKFARVPFITGDCEDEATLFAYSNANITTNAQYLEYVKTNYFPYITDEQMQALAIAYPDDVTQGSPFNTGTANALTPEFKRLAALQGDLTFQAPRRFFLEVASKTQPTYSYRYLKGASTPYVGASHGSDAVDFFGFSSATDWVVADAIIYFVCHHNPNPPAQSISLLRNTKWPKWSSSIENPPLLSFFDTEVNITSDTYRSDAIKLMIQLRKE